MNAHKHSALKQQFIISWFLLEAVEEKHFLVGSHLLAHSFMTPTSAFAFILPLYFCHVVL